MDSFELIIYEMPGKMSTLRACSPRLVSNGSRVVANVMSDNLMWIVLNSSLIAIRTPPPDVGRSFLYTLYPLRKISCSSMFPPSQASVSKTMSGFTLAKYLIVDYIC